MADYSRTWKVLDTEQKTEETKQKVLNLVAKI